MKTTFAPKIIIIRCPLCGKVKRHGEWLSLSYEMVIQLAKIEREITKLPVICPACKADK